MADPRNAPDAKTSTPDPRSDALDLPAVAPPPPPLMDVWELLSSFSW
jgi:hypothetical protein